MKPLTYIIEKISVIFVVCLFTLLAVACTVTQSVEDPVAFEGQALNTAQAPIPQNTLPSLPYEEIDLSGYPEPMPDFPVSQPTIYPTFVPASKCDITLSAPTILAEQSPSHLSFSEPIIVATTDEWFSSIQWLPDNRHLLVTREKNESEVIFTLNTETGETVEYAKRHNLSGFPIWVSQPQGVIFVEATTEGWDLRFTNSKDTSILATKLASVYLSKSPITEQVTYSFSLEPGALINTNTIGQIKLLTQTKFNAEINHIPVSSDNGYRLSWSPDGKWLLQYLHEKAFLINAETQEFCLIDISNESEEKRIGSVQWSFDSQILSFITINQYAYPQLYTLNIENLNMSIVSFPDQSGIDQIGNFTWSTQENIILLQIFRQNESVEKKLAQWILVDIFAENYFYIHPDYLFLPGEGKPAWSYDGNSVAYTCRTTDNDKSNICILNISK